LFGAIACAVLACRPPPVEDPNLLIVLIDTLRRDHLGCYGYQRDTTPVIDALAAEGTRFDQVIAQAPWTYPSVASLFTSRYPSQLPKTRVADDVAPDAKFRGALGESALTLAEILRAAGYETLAVTTNPYVSEPFGLLQGFEHRLLLVHLMDVHVPNRPPQPFYDWFDAIDGTPHSVEHQKWGFADGKRLDSESFRRFRSHRIALYDGSIRYADSAIGVMLDRLRERGHFDDTIVAVTSDHGDELWDHPEFELANGLAFRDRVGVGHGHTLFDELIEVPLILRGPGVPRAVVEQQIRLVDFAPILLGLVPTLDGGAFGFEGIDALGRWRRGELESLVALSENRVAAGKQQSLEDEDFKLFRMGQRRFLFEKPAAGLRDVSGDQPEVASRYEERLDGLLAEFEHTDGSEIQLDANLVEELRALGYIE
jgi:arylsulfatase A-like enzyme